MHYTEMLEMKAHIKDAIKEAYKEMGIQITPIASKPVLNPAQIYEQQMLAQKEVQEVHIKEKKKKKV
jgi:hypothetical protein